MSFKGNYILMNYFDSTLLVTARFFPHLIAFFPETIDLDQTDFHLLN